MPFIWLSIAVLAVITYVPELVAVPDSPARLNVAGSILPLRSGRTYHLMRGGFAARFGMGAREQDMQRRSSSRWSKTVLTFAFVRPACLRRGCR
jgi:hypothetical protein